jgi:hypothetical protein
LKRLSVPLTFSIIIGLMDLVFVLVLAYATAVESTWFPDPLNYTVTALLSVAFLASVMAECTRWLNEQGEVRAARAEERTKWIDHRAEARSKNDRQWVLREVREGTVPLRLVPQAGVYGPRPVESRDPFSEMTSGLRLNDDTGDVGAAS